MKHIRSFCLLAALSAAVVPARAQVLGLMEQAGPADEAYTKATEALDARQWNAAIQGFEAIARQGGARADAAQYWKAFAQNKAGQREAALASLKELRERFAKSRWANDGRALEVEIRQALGQPVAPEAASDEELKLMALNGLMQSDPERALPILQKLLSGSSSRRLQERAMFVLSQCDSAKARQMLLDIARDNSKPEMQRQAVRVIGFTGGKENRPLLAEIYNSGAPPEVKREVLAAYMVAGDKDRLAALARTEKDDTLRREAIRQLGVMGAESALAELYNSETKIELRREILQSFMIGGASERLMAAAQGEKNPELRGKAVELLGVMSKEKTGALLMSIYAKESEPSVRRRVLNALFIQGDAKPLIEIARKEQDPRLKREAVEKLSLMRSAEAKDYMLELLNK